MKAILLRPQWVNIFEVKEATGVKCIDLPGTLHQVGQQGAYHANHPQYWNTGLTSHDKYWGLVAKVGYAQCISTRDICWFALKGFFVKKMFNTTSSWFEIYQCLLFPCNSLHSSYTSRCYNSWSSLVQVMALQSHYLIQYWLMVNWILWKKLSATLVKLGNFLLVWCIRKCLFSIYRGTI